MTSLLLESGLGADDVSRGVRGAGRAALLASGLAALAVTLVCFIPTGLVACAHALGACNHALGGRERESLAARRLAARWCCLTVGLGLVRDAPLLAAWAGFGLL